MAIGPGSMVIRGNRWCTERSAKMPSLITVHTLDFESIPYLAEVLQNHYSELHRQAKSKIGKQKCHELRIYLQVLFKSMATLFLYFMLLIPKLTSNYAQHRIYFTTSELGVRGIEHVPTKQLARY